LNNCNGHGSNPWVFTIIDYYGPGFILKDGLKEQIAMLPSWNYDLRRMEFEYINLNHLACEFARKPKTFTLIFNHSSTEELELAEEEKKNNEKNYEDKKYKFG
jgi:hypothetical protein